MLRSFSFFAPGRQSLQAARLRSLRGRKPSGVSERKDAMEAHGNVSCNTAPVALAPPGVGRTII